MKFIKLFESFNKKGIKETCEDILLELRDVGFESVVYTDVIDFDQKIIPNAIAVSIGYEATPFNYDDIKEVVNRLFDYLENEGYSLQYTQ